MPKADGLKPTIAGEEHDRQPIRRSSRRACHGQSKRILRVCEAQGLRIVVIHCWNMGIWFYGMFTINAWSRSVVCAPSIIEVTVVERNHSCLRTSDKMSTLDRLVLQSTRRLALQVSRFHAMCLFVTLRGGKEPHARYTGFLIMAVSLLLPRGVPDFAVRKSLRSGEYKLVVPDSQQICLMHGRYL
jgi:hypothetical protein